MFEAVRRTMTYLDNSSSKLVYMYLCTCIVLGLCRSPAGGLRAPSPLTTHEWKSRERLVSSAIASLFALYTHHHHRHIHTLAANFTHISARRTTAIVLINFAPHVSVNLVMGLAALSLARLLQSQ